MTGLHDKPTTRRSKRLENSRAEAAAAALPPARRARRAEGKGSITPGEREVSVPAARVKRSRSPPHPKPDSEDVIAAKKEPQLVPPPKREGSAGNAWPLTAYVLRNRHVPDTSNREPYFPAPYEQREELGHDRPCSSRKKLKQEEPWEAPACARMALEHYNSMNQGGEHELVKAVGVHSFLRCGMWLHANFLARRKGANNCVDLVPKYFFAELNLDVFGLLCASCVKIDSVESKNLGGCGVCPERIMHPADGEYLGAQPRRIRPADSGLQLSFSF